MYTFETRVAGSPCPSPIPANACSVVPPINTCSRVQDSGFRVQGLGFAVQG